MDVNEIGLEFIVWNHLTSDLHLWARQCTFNKNRLIFLLLAAVRFSAKIP
jgi:hypothetical protein